jgi:imidazolonepropionase-like amidohydrolase
VGTVEVGKDADLLVLAADPLADADNLTRVAAVFRRGARVR